MELMMSEEYFKYLKKHKNNVQKAFNWMRKNMAEFLKDNTCYDNITLIHDLSKFDKEEYEAYDAYFYGKEKTPEIKEAFNKAWLRHIHMNPHHWQYWVLINDDPDNGTIILRMPHKYVIEMICDWWSFSWEKNNLYEIFDWYNERKDYIKLHEDTRKEVEDILSVIRLHLDYKYLIGKGIEE